MQRNRNNCHVYSKNNSFLRVIFFPKSHTWQVCTNVMRQMSGIWDMREWSEIKNLKYSAMYKHEKEDCVWLNSSSHVDSEFLCK